MQLMCRFTIYSFFFFNDTATTEIYTLSLHDALPIFPDHQTREKGQSSQEIPERRVAMQPAFQDRVIQDEEARIQEKSDGERTHCGFYTHLVIMRKCKKHHDHGGDRQLDGTIRVEYDAFYICALL